jgi:hypothetical protein
MRLPLRGWAAVISVNWFYRILRGVDASAEEIARADAAAAWLAGLTRKGTTVYVITHGAFRRLLAKRLLAGGWHADAGRRSYKTWSAWSFSRPRMQP